MADRLDDVAKQAYPLVISEYEAREMVRRISRIMGIVSEDIQAAVRWEYDTVTSALRHPVVDGEGQSNRRV